MPLRITVLVVFSLSFPTLCAAQCLSGLPSSNCWVCVHPPALDAYGSRSTDEVSTREKEKMNGKPRKDFGLGEQGYSENVTEPRGGEHSSIHIP
ncbi:hypothetical protein L209DRAFT_749799 [Thermothelomyces heterothallicus CBS 203.75]